MKIIIVVEDGQIQFVYADNPKGKTLPECHVVDIEENDVTEQEVEPLANAEDTVIDALTDAGVIKEAE